VRGDWCLPSASTKPPENPNIQKIATDPNHDNTCKSLQQLVAPLSFAGQQPELLSCYYQFTLGKVGGLTHEVSLLDIDFSIQITPPNSDIGKLMDKQLE
jgi:hypothetical protein